MKPERLTATFFLCVIMIFMCLVPASVANKFVHKLTNPEEVLNIIDIDWEKLYPFDDDAGFIPKKKKDSMIDYVKEKIENYTSNKLLGGRSVIEAGKMYEELIGWNMTAVLEYNPVIKLHDGYLSGLAVSGDISENARAVKGLDDFCREQGIEFMYINFPAKICISEDRDISGTLDFANQNADRFLRQLEDEGVRYYDFRRLLHEEGMKHHEAFFVTDHHWKPETGLWAAQHILQILRDDYGWDVKPEILNPENFEHVVYHDWFLGSQGKKFTLARTRPDDFTLLYPKFKVLLNYEVPSYQVNVSGDFSNMYYMKLIENKDLYGADTYYTYGLGNYAVGGITNLLCANSKKVLVLKDSFARTVIPFLALGINRLDELDLRDFTGSVKQYIISSKPDMIIITYTSTMTVRNQMYDFR